MLRSLSCHGLAITLALSGCATPPHPSTPSAAAATTAHNPCDDSARNIGLLGGALAGALLGKAMGKSDKSVWIGGAIGGAVGGLIGADMDRRRCELARVAAAHQLDVLVSDIAVRTSHDPAPSAGDAVRSEAATNPVGLSVTIFDPGTHFAPGSPTPTPQALRAYADVAAQYRVRGPAAKGAVADASAERARRDRERQVRILLVGHTDDTGGSATNADLSEARARAVARVFEQQGFDAGQIYFQGAGEVFPIADNRTESGRARNRRVEIVDLTDDATFAAYLAARRPQLANYRPVVPRAGADAVPDTAVGAAAASATGSTVERRSDKSPAKKTASTGQDARPPAKGPRTVASAGTSAKAGAAGARTPSRRADAPPRTSPHQPGGSVVAASPGAARAASASTLDLGGQPLPTDARPVDIGALRGTGGFSLISEAHAADELPLGPCALDRPRISHAVKSLRTGQALRTSDHLPGLAGTSWAAKVNGHLVGLTDVRVLRDGAEPVSRPVLHVWKHHVDGSKAPSDLRTVGDANAYRGDKAVLYRVFASEGPVRCVDLLIPHGTPHSAPRSSLVYERTGTLLQADYAPSIVR